MSALPLAKQLVGYADEISVEPGQRVRFYVSCDPGVQRFRAQVVRLVGDRGDTQRPDVRYEVVPSDADGDYEALEQPVVPGSYAAGNLTAPAVRALAGGATVVFDVRPLLRTRHDQVVLAIGDPWAEDGMAVYLDPAGRAALALGRTERVAADEPVPLSAWTTVVVSWTAAGDVTVSVQAAGGWSSTNAAGAAQPAWLAGMPVTLGAVRASDGTRAAHLAGRLERPVVLAGARDPASAVTMARSPRSRLVAGWDFAADIGSWNLRDIGPNGVDLTLHNLPQRAVCGRGWREGSTDWQSAPRQYAAIHFYPDSLEDCEWLSQFSFTVPEGLRSGCYAARLIADDQLEWIPFFVRSASERRDADIVFIASTATYAAYANSRFWWEDPLQEVAQDSLVELGADEQYLLTHPELGLSCYDQHLDGSPVSFSSRLRPNLFMRPGHSRGEAYAADLYLIDWLEQVGLRYDVITDEDLHHQGRAALRGYRLALSGSHPEYCSIRMHDAMSGWVNDGGRYAYLGGNGFTCNVTWRSDRPWIMEDRATGRMMGELVSNRGEATHMLDGLKGDNLSDAGRATGSLFGVDSATMGFDRAYPVVRQEASYLPEFAFAFEGITRPVLGGRSRLGGVIGQEWDNARHVEGAAGHYVLARSVDHSLIPLVLGMNAVYHGDVVFYFHGRGVVFSTGSMAWVSGLGADNCDNDISRFTRNVLTRLAEPAPVPRPPCSST